MSTEDRAALASHCLGALSAAESARLDEHLATCAACQSEYVELMEVRELMGTVPPEILLDDPLPDDDPLLARILAAAAELEAARPTGPDATVGPELAAGADTAAEPKMAAGAELAAGAGSAAEANVAAGGEAAGAAADLPPNVVPLPRRGWRTALLSVAAGIVALALIFGGGVLVGRPSQSGSVAASGDDDSDSSTGALSVRTLAAHDVATGAAMTVKLSAFPGWVGVWGSFTGVAPGADCVIVLVTDSGQRVVAAQWVAPPGARGAAVTVNGSAIVAAGDVRSVEMDLASGQRLVSGSF